ncbi:MAG: DEAD/DEAH box helicase [Chitinophagales bacterium]
MSNIFEHFKRQNQLDFRTQKPKNIFFQLDFDEFGAFISVTDDIGKEVTVNHLNYSGAVRSILRSIENIKEKSAFVIDWEKPSDKVYLAEHDFLLWQLKNCDNFLDHRKRPIQFQTEQASVNIRIQSIEKQPDSKLKSEVEKWYDTDIVLTAGGKIFEGFQMLTEEMALAEALLFEVKSLGRNFGQLGYFETEIPAEDINKYLSLLYSNMDNVDVLFEDYQAKVSTESIEALPALIFEKIDLDEALYMRVTQTLPNMDVAFLQQFDLHRIAELNELERTINIRYIERQPLEELINNIDKILSTHLPKKKGKGSSETQIVSEGNLFIIPKVVASGFLYHELPKLLADFNIYGAEKLKSYKIAPMQPTLNLSLNHGIDFLEGDASLDFEGELISLFDAITQYDKQKYVLLSDGTHAVVNGEYIKKLQRIFRKKKKGVELSFFDLPFVEELIDEKVAQSTFKKSRAIFEGFNNLASKRTQLPDLKAELRPYQKQGFKWLNYLYENKLGGCLADDMGLGKTLQAIAVLANIYPETTLPSLIIMPRSLLFNWRNEVEKFAPQLTMHTYYGQQRNWNEALKHQLIFTTYAIARNDIEALKEEEFQYVILDESQNIKNIQAQTTKAVMLLQAKHRMALSGTPIENNLGELYSLFRFLNPSMFGTIGMFNDNYATPIQKDNNPEVIQELRRKIYPFVLRRLKKDVLTELPDKIEQTLYVEMSKKQKKLYEQRRQFYQNAIQSQIAQKGLQQTRFFIFQALNELRQIASIPEAKSDGKILSPKREMLQEQVLDAIANGHKVLIFVNFLAAIELIGEQLDNEGIDFVSMTGSTRDRQTLVNRFQNDPNCSVFLMTLKTGGTGLNLTAADTVFIFDPWWNGAAETQAIDRAHRMGQTSKVLAYKMITQGSIEEKILQLQEKKKELFDNIISADAGAMKSLSEEDINFILG